MKNLLKRFSSGPKPLDRKQQPWKSCKFEEQKEKQMKKSEQSLRDLWETTKETIYTEWKTQKEREKESQIAYWRNNSQKFPKFEEKHKYTNTRNSMNSK